MQEEKVNPKNIEFEILGVDAGWIDYNIYANEQLAYRGIFSHVFDPLPDLKKWLGAIAIGVQQCSFVYNPEGGYIRFSYERVSYDQEQFIISDKTGKEIDFLCRIEKTQFVRAFYKSILKFAESNAYKPKQWETEYVKERFEYTDEDELIQILLRYDRKNLIEIFSKAAPDYIPERIESKDGEDEIPIDEILKNIKSSIQRGTQESCKWEIPVDYDLWPEQQKRKTLKKFLNYAVEGYDGMSLSDFRSVIIDDFLSTSD